MSLISCGNDGSSPALTTSGTATPDAKADAVDPADSATATASDASADGTPQASCVGSAALEQFKAFNDHCAFLGQCSGSGKCYCGKGCSADKAPCNPEVCKNQDTACWCGETCQAEKKVQCPQFVCNAFDIKGCEQKEGCKYVATPPPSWCGCTKMSDKAPPCWCGTTCDKSAIQGYVECPAAKCTGKDPQKCIVVPGAKHETCWCDTCGLFGDKPTCFFVRCP